MTENEIIKGWSFKETIKATENLMEVESKMFKWDVLRHLRDFAKKFKDELEQYRAIGLTPELIEAMQGHNIALINDLGEYQQIGTIEELQALKEEVEAYRNLDKTNFSDGYNKAIDEFAEKLNTDVESFVAEVDGVRADLLTLDYFSEFVFEVAEELKRGWCSNDY